MRLNGELYGMSTGYSRQDDDCDKKGHTPAYFDRWLRSIESLMDERDRRYEDKFRALDSATEKALAAVREQTASAFKANETAISKAEEAQRSYNERSNEFRGQLDDQAKRLMSREEALSKFVAYDEKLDDCKSEIGKLREAAMALGGRDLQRIESRHTAQWTVGQAIAVALVLSGFIVTIVLTLLKP